PIEFLAILQNLLLLCRTQILKTPRLQITRIRWPVRIETRLPGGLVASIWRAIPADHAHRFRLWALRFPVRRNVTLRTILARTVVVRPPVLRSPIFLLRLSALLPWRLPLLWLPLWLRRLIRIVLLRRTRQRHRRADCHHGQPSAELESQFHCTLHLLLALLPAIVFLNRRRQFRQQREIHSRANGTRRTPRGAFPPPAARFPSSARPRIPEFYVPSGCSS